MVVVTRDPDQHVVLGSNCCSNFASKQDFFPADVVNSGSFRLGFAELKSLGAEKDLATLLGVLVLCWSRKVHLSLNQKQVRLGRKILLMTLVTLLQLY